MQGQILLKPISETIAYAEVKDQDTLLQTKQGLLLAQDKVQILTPKDIISRNKKISIDY